MHARRHAMRRGMAVGLAAAAGALVVVRSVPTPAPAPATASATTYCVGAAKMDITPSAAMVAAGTFYLGGYGIGPSHAAKAVLRPLYARAIAIGVPGADGTCPGPAAEQVVVAADDLQGHFLAYQQGPYGFADVQRTITGEFGIPASHVVIQSTHTHNGPDDLGIWGGVPTAYLAEVAGNTAAAIAEAVGGEVPATLRVATADMPGFAATFPTQQDAADGGPQDSADFPDDTQLRMLQAVSVASGQVVATMLNFSVHPTVYGPLDEVSPDWPGAAASYLEGDQQGTTSPTGFPGSIAVVTVGAVGHAWPAPVPAGSAAPDAPAGSDDNAGADAYGDAVAHRGVQALGGDAQLLSGPAVVDGAAQSIAIATANPALLAAVLLPVPGLHAYRADTPPYEAGPLITSTAEVLRVGNLALFGAPGEPWPSIQFTLAKEIATPVLFPLGLADDQLGYLSEPGEYLGAQTCSPTDEGLFTLSPTFGSQFEAAARHLAVSLGFEVGTAAPAPVTTGNFSGAVTCAEQQVTAGAQDPSSLLP